MTDLIEVRVLGKEEAVDLPDDLRLIADILEARSNGHTDSLHGNSNEDLLGAIENVRDKLTTLEHKLKFGDQS